jgi:hypothetical protein
MLFQNSAIMWKLLKQMFAQLDLYVCLLYDYFHLVGLNLKKQKNLILLHYVRN